MPPPDLFLLVLPHPDVTKQPDGTGEAKAWCPRCEAAHSKTPNLGINVKKKVVECFVCGRGGIRKLALAWGFEEAAAGPNRAAQKEPFLSAEAAMQALEEAYGLKAATIERIRQLIGLELPKGGEARSWRVSGRSQRVSIPGTGDTLERLRGCTLEVQFEATVLLVAALSQPEGAA